MKTPISYILSVLMASFLLVSCGSATQSEYPLALKLELPAALAKGESRREKFLQRADILTINIKTRGGENLSQTYAKSHWEKILLPSFPFPKSPEDKMEVQVEVHAKDGEGTRITEAVLKGEGSFEGKEAKAGVQNTLAIKLSLTVQPETWD